jgi:hypothetical protein
VFQTQNQENAMHAVIVDGAVVYLGNDGDKAVEILTSKKEQKASLVSVSTLGELASALRLSQAEENVSQAVERLFEILDEAGVNEKSVKEVVDALREKGDAAVAEVRHLGIKGMATMGDGFVALGDLLKKAPQKEPEDG